MRTRSRLRPLAALVATAVAVGLLTAPNLAAAEERLLSQGKQATSSSTEGDLVAGRAFDGRADTRWGSAFATNEWVQVDLGAASTLTRVELDWEAAYGRGYEIQVSDSATGGFRTVHTERAGDGGRDAFTITGTGRYVRLQGLERATPWGYSLWEFRVYGESAGGGGGGDLPTSDTPDLGPNVKVYDPSTPVSTIQGQIDAAFRDQLLSPTAQFGTQRHVFLFKPGDYGRVWANVGFYTTVAGLGRNPDDVTINGAVNVDSGWNYGDERNATQNFWRSMENLAIVPDGGTNRWAVSQAAPMRRVHVRGNLTLAPSNQDFGQGYASGGYLADSVVDGTISSGSQQQWYTRNSTIGRWEGGVWNMVFSGVRGAPPNAFPNPPHTTLATTPVTREKPYLYVDGAGKYAVFVPDLQRDSAGASWPNTPGTSIPMREFYVARPGDSAARLNQALASGLNLYFTPGTYTLDQTLRVTRPDTVVTGIGFPTLVPQGGVTAMSVADVAGVKVSGLTFDAGETNSETLMTVGTEGQHRDHAANPVVLQDLFFRIGSSIQGRATTTLVVHSDDTVIDHIWAWRADHGGAPTGWNVNTGDTGLVVTGDDVLATGLFVEHYQKYEVIWRGERGRTIFFQNEKPYDVPDQAAWRGPTGNGYAAYKVTDNVNDHQLWGGGVYSYFNVNPSVRVNRGFEVPERPGVVLRSVITVSLGDTGTIENVVNDTGGSVPNPAGNTVPRQVVRYPAG